MKGENSVGCFTFRLVCHEFGPVFRSLARSEDAFRVAQDEEAFDELDGDVVPNLDVRELDVKSFRFRLQCDVPHHGAGVCGECLLYFCREHDSVDCVVHGFLWRAPEDSSEFDAGSVDVLLCPSASVGDGVLLVLQSLLDLLCVCGPAIDLEVWW